MVHSSLMLFLSSDLSLQQWEIWLPSSDIHSLLCSALGHTYSSFRTVDWHHRVQQLLQLERSSVLGIVLLHVLYVNTFLPQELLHPVLNS